MVGSRLPIDLIFVCRGRMNLQVVPSKCDTRAHAQDICAARLILLPYAPPTLRTVTFTLKKIWFKFIIRYNKKAVPSHKSLTVLFDDSAIIRFFFISIGTQEVFSVSKIDKLDSIITILPVYWNLQALCNCYIC